ncbi:hypothetical protein CTRI78_v006739 [Colletotrichum trifolii]|uniref:BZIP domain-containing protein n=1 Tax=Colletotrichum trifolii TaxID=5466 RepID=A0A4R8REV9_COLTR|nr:hypothetical protein CTRI78_v006739 [Colletotrichum trifolii]
MAPGSPLAPRRRANRVSAQHTLERVRNNQRRHRARRKDHIVTLEQELVEAEQTITTLREEVEALQAALTRCHRQPHDRIETDCRTLQPQRPQKPDGTLLPPLIDTHGEAVQACSALFDTENLKVRELPVPALTEPLVGDEQPGSEVSALIPPSTESPQALMPIPMAQPCGEFVSNQAVAEAGSLLPPTVIEDHTLTPTIPCCSIDPSSDSQPTVNTADRMALDSSQENFLLMPWYMVQPAMEACYQASPYGESTMLCSEAYILIAQQNFKGLDRGGVVTWLWNSFRRPLGPGLGCRVNTDMLFSLLAFISDP